MVGVNSVKPDQRSLKKMHTLHRCVFCFYKVSHFTCDLSWAAGAEELTVNMHAVHNFTVIMS